MSTRLALRQSGTISYQKRFDYATVSTPRDAITASARLLLTAQVKLCTVWHCLRYAKQAE